MYVLFHLQDSHHCLYLLDGLKRISTKKQILSKKNLKNRVTTFYHERCIAYGGWWQQERKGGGGHSGSYHMIMCRPRNPRVMSTGGSFNVDCFP
jgi:hypothetical protein